MAPQALPNEILLIIGEHIYYISDLASYTRVNRVIHHHLTPLLYRLCSGPSYYGLEWASCRGLITTAQRFLDAGSNIDRCVAQSNFAHPYHRNWASGFHRNTHGKRPKYRLPQRTRSPLMWAVAANQYAMVRFLVEKGADLEYAYGNEKTALVMAVLYRNPGMVKLLLELGAKPTPEERLFASPLRRAVQKGPIQNVRLLLEAGADPDHQDDDDIEMLGEAIILGRIRYMKLLTRYGAKVNGTEWMRAFAHTPLFVAARMGDLRSIKFLLRRGADIHTAATNDFGETPLGVAAMKGHLDAIKLLVENGAAFDPTDLNGQTPVYYAAVEGHADVVRYLLQLGADPMAKSDGDYTPMYTAADAGQLEVIEVLMEFGATVDDFSRTALQNLANMAVGDGVEVRLEKLKKLGFVPDADAVHRHWLRTARYAATFGTS